MAQVSATAKGSLKDSGQAPAPATAAKEVAQAQPTKAELPKEIEKAEQKAPPFTITPMTKQRRWLKGIVYGKYGSGKTFLVSTAVAVADMRDVLLINAEKGDLTLEGNLYDFSRIDLININDFASFARVTEFLKQHCIARDNEDEKLLKKMQLRLMGDVTGNSRRYRTVIVDSLAEIETFYMYQLLGIADHTKLDEMTATPEWAEYKRNLGTITRTMRTLRDLPIHVLYTCPSAWSQDETKQRHHTLKLTGQLSSAAQGFVDLVGRLVTRVKEDNTIDRRLIVQPTSSTDAKCRFSSFAGAYFDNPTMESILKAVGLSIGERR